MTPFMNNDYFQRNKGVIYISLVIITIITIFPLFSTGLGCGDDIHNYLTARKGDYFHIANWLARTAGRFYFILVYPFYDLPYIGDNIAITKLFQLVPLISCFIIFAIILFSITKSKEFSFLFLLLSLSLSQISGHTCLFITYPFFFTFSFSLLLLSFLFLLHYLEKKKKLLLVCSVILFALGLLFYEVYILFLLFVAMIIITNKFSKEYTLVNHLKNSFILFIPYLCVAIVYLVAYLVFRSYHPSTYDGTMMAFEGFKWSSFFHVLWSLSYTSFPLTVFKLSGTLFTEKSGLVHGYSPVVLQLILNARVEWIVKGLLVSISGFLLMMSIMKPGTKFLLRGIFASILLIFAPHIPLALTTKYVYYTTVGMLGYVTTFFSLFGVMLLITLLVNFFIALVNFNFIVKKIAGIALMVVLFSISVMTDFSNYHIARDTHCANIRFYAVDELVKSEQFREIPEGSKFYANDLYINASHTARNLTEQSFSWSQYIYEKIKTNYDMIQEEKAFRESASDTTKELYYINMKQAFKTDDLSIALGQIDHSAFKDSIIGASVNRALITYYSTYKYFTISFRCNPASSKDKIPLKINHLSDTIQAGTTITFSIFNTKQFQPATIFTIEAEAIDLKSVIISNMINPESRIIYL